MGGTYFIIFLLQNDSKVYITKRSSFFIKELGKNVLPNRLGHLVLKTIRLITKRGSYYKTSRFYYKTRENKGPDKGTYL